MQPHEMELLDAMHDLAWQVFNMQAIVVRELLGRDLHRHDPVADAVVRNAVPVPLDQVADTPAAKPETKRRGKGKKPLAKLDNTVDRTALMALTKGIIADLRARGMTYSQIEASLQIGGGCVSGWALGKYVPKKDKFNALKALHAKICGEEVES